MYNIYPQSKTINTINIYKYTVTPTVTISWLFKAEKSVLFRDLHLKLSVRSFLSPPLYKKYFHKKLQHNTHQTKHWNTRHKDKTEKLRDNWHGQLIVEHKNTNDNKGDIKNI